MSRHNKQPINDQEEVRFSKINKECIYTHYQVWVTAVFCEFIDEKQKIVGACDIFKIVCFVPQQTTLQHQQ